MNRSFADAVAKFLAKDPRVGVSTTRGSLAHPADGCGCCRDGIHVVHRTKPSWRKPVFMALIGRKITALPIPDECTWCGYATDRLTCPGCGAEKLRCLSCRSKVWAQDGVCKVNPSHQVIHRAKLHSSFMQDLDEDADKMAIPSEEGPRIALQSYDEEEYLALEDRCLVGGQINDRREPIVRLAYIRRMSTSPEFVAEVYEDLVQEVI